MAIPRSPRPWTVGARELKTKLGAYLRAVQRGQRIVVTERGEPVAELRPLAEAARSEQGQLDRLLALGVLSRRSPRPLAPFKSIRHVGRPLSETISEDRKDRF